jgi:hypothetical protein
VVVFFGSEGWTETIDAAEIAVDPAGAQTLESRGREAMERNEVVDANLIEVVPEDGRVRPVRLRERLRTLGPSVRPDLGKQASHSGGLDVPL